MGGTSGRWSCSFEESFQILIVAGESDIHNNTTAHIYLSVTPPKITKSKHLPRTSS